MINLREHHKYTARHRDDDVVVALPERLDVHQVRLVHHQLQQLELGGGDRVAFDGSAIVHMDRYGLECLADARTHCEAVGAELVITDPSVALRLAVELTSLVGAPVMRYMDAPAEFDALAA